MTFSPKPFNKIAVLGAGSFGTAVAAALCRRAEGGDGIILYGRNPEVVESINRRHRNERKLPGIDLPGTLRATDSLPTAVDRADLLVLAIPAQHLSRFLIQWQAVFPPGIPLLNLAKGIEKSSRRTMSKLISDTLAPGCGGSGCGPLASLSGPSFAADVARGFPVGVTVASGNRSFLARLQNQLSTTEFDVKITTDLAGVEIGGALKNIFAIAAGIFAGCNTGRSLAGDFFTRAMAEMRDVGIFLGGKWPTFSGRAGLGDLVVTCGEPSRNFRLGKIYATRFNRADGKGETPGTHDRVFEETISELGTRTVEGYDTLEPVHQLAARHRLFTPVITGTYRLLFEKTITPSALLSYMRTIDTSRRREGPGVLSILMHSLLPRLWYRRLVHR